MSKLISTDGLVIDWSMASAFQTCERKFFWRYVLDLQGKRKATALLLGAAVHKGLEVYYSSKKDETKALMAYFQYAKQIGLSETVEEARAFDEDEKGRSIELGALILVDYFEYYEMDTISVLETEIGVSIILIPGKLVYAGKIDGICEYGNQIYVLEHKTTGSLGYSFYDRLGLSAQISGYAAGINTITDYKCKGAVVNALVTTGVLQYPKGLSRYEAMGKRFGRLPVTRTPAELDRDMNNMTRIGLRIIHSLQENEFLMNTSSCCDFNRVCEYQQICFCTHEEIREKLIVSQYDVVPWIPLEHLNQDF